MCIPRACVLLVASFVACITLHVQALASLSSDDVLVEFGPFQVIEEKVLQTWPTIDPDSDSQTIGLAAADACDQTFPFEPLSIASPFICSQPSIPCPTSVPTSAPLIQSFSVPAINPIPSPSTAAVPIVTSRSVQKETVKVPLLSSVISSPTSVPVTHAITNAASVKSTPSKRFKCKLALPTHLLPTLLRQSDQSTWRTTSLTSETTMSSDPITGPSSSESSAMVHIPAAVSSLALASRS